MSIEQLSEDQMKWLNSYKSINLEQWRLETILSRSRTPKWYYIGDSVANGESLIERKTNLERNKYHYWPDNASSLANKWSPEFVGSAESWKKLWEDRSQGEEPDLDSITRFCKAIWFDEKLKPMIGGPDRRKEFSIDLLAYIKART